MGHRSHIFYRAGFAANVRIEPRDSGLRIESVGDLVSETARIARATRHDRDRGDAESRVSDEQSVYRFGANLGANGAANALRGRSAGLGRWTRTGLYGSRNSPVRPRRAR